MRALALLFTACGSNGAGNTSNASDGSRTTNSWFTEADGRKIGRITPQGVVTEFPDPERASPGSIAAGKDGNLWFSEAGGSNSIGRVTPEGSVAEYPVPSAARAPSGISAGPDAAWDGTSHACSFTVHGAAP